MVGHGKPDGAKIASTCRIASLFGEPAVSENGGGAVSELDKPRWARGHQEGFRISPTKSQHWRTLYLAGWDANVPLFKSPDKPVTFSFKRGPEMTLKEALNEVAKTLDTVAAT